MRRRGDGLGGTEVGRARTGAGTRLALIAAAMLAAVLALPAAALATGTEQETWVSAAGTDSGSCQLSAPCATLAYALSETAPGGDIDILTSGS
jgi:hypothetical protein